MKTRTFIGLAVVTLLVIAGAVWVTQERSGVVQPPHERAFLYPGLLQRLNDVTEVRVESNAEGSVTVRQAGDGWELVERYGYPVRFERVRETLIELGALETIEPMTRRAENYSRLNVDDLDGGTSEAVRVTVSAGGETLADILVGSTRTDAGGSGVFVRRVGDEQAWLATGSYRPERRALLWLDRNIANVDSRRVREVVMRHPDGGGFVMVRDRPGDGGWRLEGELPEGTEPKPPGEMNAMAGVTDFLIFEDVRPVEELNFDEDAIVSTYDTFDGIRLTIDAVIDDGRTWARVRASAIDRADGIDAFIEEHRDSDSAEGRTASQLASPEDAADQIERVNARAAPWAYRLTDYKTGKVTQRLADMVQAVPEPEAVEPEAAAEPETERSD